MNKIAHLIESLDDIANDMESEDKQIALAIDRISDLIEKKAFFNQSTWLPGRTTRAYPNIEQRVRNKGVKNTLYVCSSCNLRRYMIACQRCPHCGHFMYRVS